LHDLVGAKVETCQKNTFAPVRFGSFEWEAGGCFGFFDSQTLDRETFLRTAAAKRTNDDKSMKEIMTLPMASR
jgi:hypothetical protein